MFRQIKRVKQALNKEECLEILKKEKRGVLSVLGDDDYPYGMPINHYYDEDTHKLYFHGGRYGHKTLPYSITFCVLISIVKPVQIISISVINLIRFTI